MRETQEELGVRARSAHLIGHFPLGQLNQLLIAYEIRAEGELTLGDEIAEVKVLSPTELAARLHLRRARGARRTP